MENGNGNLLTAADILACKERRYAKAVIPGHGTIRLRSLTAGEMASYHEAMARSPSGARYMPIQLCVVNEHGELEFTVEQAKELAKIDGALFEAIYAAASKHSSAGTIDDLIDDSKKN